MTTSIAAILAEAQWWSRIVDYKVYRGNNLWRFLLVLLVVMAALAAGRIIQFAVRGYAGRLAKRKGERPFSLVLKALVKPLYVAMFAGGIFIAKIPLYFDDEDGIHVAISDGWTTIARVVAAMYVLGAGKVKSLLLGAGVGGVAIALAAKDTIANFFGSVTIFTDRPFQMGEMVKIGDHSGPVEEVGFRSTRVRTLQGHLVTIPNSKIVDTAVENIGKRPFIRRTSNLTITYDSGHEKTSKAVEIVKEVLAGVPEINSDPDRPPRVYFSDFNDWSLNIYMSYWVKPPDYWLYQEVNERVNFEIMKRFEAEKIEFAFPSQTLYMKKE
ncbi:MAG: mechanosensitive ion channel family protein [Planctomycetota bacterium]|jgi:small-conductance mechanosensitive channel